MADFYTHVTTSSVLGVGYAGMGVVSGMPIETSLVAGGLCGASGMLPDLDSDSGIPIREAMGFAAGVVPMLLVDRFQALEMPYDWMVLLTAGLYFFIRFAGASLLGRFTVHRGMFHSIPAAFIFAGIAFLICGCPNIQVRYFKAGAVFFGVMSHLLLDEVYSIEWRGGSWRFKKSFGTALKLWGKNGWANISTYTKLAVVGILISGEPSVMQYLEQQRPGLATRMKQIHGYQGQLIDGIRDQVTPTSPGEGDLPPDTNVVDPAAPPTDWTTQPVGPIDNPAGSPPWNGFAPADGGFRPNSGTPTQQAQDGGFFRPNQNPVPR